ncbi:MAG: T9SS type A sorting domain-containing protein [Bacteroidota bacterium]
MKPLALVSIMLSLSVLSAQDLQRCRQYIGTAGSSSFLATNYISYSVGEAVIGTLSSPSTTITQGFQQPELCVVVSVDVVEAGDDWSIRVFPNPTQQQLNLQWRGTGSIPDHRISIVDSSNRSLYLSDLTNLSTSQINLLPWPSGTYYLQIITTTDQAPLIVPFVLQH